MHKDLLDPESLWQVILLQLVQGLATQKAEDVAAQYTQEATQIVTEKGLTRPQDVINATLDMVERKQRWSNSLIKFALLLRGTTRAKEKAKFAEAALAQVQAKQLTDPGAVVAETIAVVRAKQDWDSVAGRLGVSEGG